LLGWKEGRTISLKLENCFKGCCYKFRNLLGRKDLLATTCFKFSWLRRKEGRKEGRTSSLLQLQHLLHLRLDLLQLQNLLLGFQGSTSKIGFAWKNVSTTLKKLLGVKGSLQLHNVLSRIIPTTTSKIAWASKHDLSIT
jgi:hypothetical protein